LHLISFYLRKGIFIFSMEGIHFMRSVQAVMVPKSEPTYTSTKKCWSKYMREKATVTATDKQRNFSIGCLTQTAISAKKAKAEVV